MPNCLTQPGQTRGKHGVEGFSAHGVLGPQETKWSLEEGKPFRCATPRDDLANEGCSDGLDADQVMTESYEQSERYSQLEINWRHAGWAGDRAKIRAAMVAVGTPEKKLANFDHCGDAPRFWINKKEKRRILRGHYCHNPLCKPCAKAAGSALARAIRAKLEGDHYVSIVVSLKSRAEPLWKSWKRLKKCFAKLRATRYFREHCDGGCYKLEGTFNKKTRLWHPHFHGVARAHWLDWKIMKPLWLKITGDSDDFHVNGIADAKKAAEEVAKYTAKAIDASVINDPDALQEFVVAMRGQRKVNTWGKWRGYCVVKKSKLEHPEDWTPAERLGEVIEAANRGELWAKSFLDPLKDPDQVKSGASPPLES